MIDGDSQILSITPKSLCRWWGRQWLYLDCGNSDHQAWLSPKPFLPPGPGPNCRQAGHWKVDLPTSPRQSKVSCYPHPPPQESLSSSGTSGQRLILPWYLCHQLKAMRTTGAWDGHLANGLVSVILLAILGYLDYISCYSLSFSDLWWYRQLG